jgi:hypothetical protein
MRLEDRVAALDATLFEHLESQTSEEDRRSLLALQSALADELSRFTYLEIGSHLGGSLQTFVADPRCIRVTSIDSRPLAQPDDRGPTFEYPDNSTERMLELLATVPGADMEKVRTIDASTDDVDPESVPRPDLCFIDAEHTYEAALRDAHFCRAVCRGTGVIAFHDRAVVEPAICDFVAETRGPCRAYPLVSGIFVVELGTSPRPLRQPSVRSQLAAPQAVWLLANRAGLARAALSAARHARRLLRSD